MLNAFQISIAKITPKVGAVVYFESKEYFKKLNHGTNNNIKKPREFQPTLNCHWFVGLQVVSVRQKTNANVPINWTMC
ncbi:hypothetical protein BAA08_06365 [Bizionia sp. APA-3]|nr:hypothetical protein BAA08_06365 [Bizionia sp. APA-3]